MKFLNTLEKIKYLVIFSTFVMLTACQGLGTIKDSQGTARESVSPEVIQNYRRAIQLMNIGSHDEAMTVFEQVSKQNDQLSGPYVNRGLIFLEQDRNDDAEKSFRDALTRNPQNVTALNQLGVIERKMGNYDAAKEFYTSALKADSKHANTHLNFGILCDIYLQDKSCALRHYEEYQRLKKDESVNNWVLDLKEQMK